MRIVFKLLILYSEHAHTHINTRTPLQPSTPQVRMCRCDREVWERVEAANTLAYLTEVSTDLQRTAAMTDHLIHTMNDYLKYTTQPNASVPQGISISPIVSITRLSRIRWFICSIFPGFCCYYYYFECLIDVTNFFICLSIPLTLSLSLSLSLVLPAI